MTAVEQALASTTYALFALEQPLPLAELASGAQTSTFPAVTTRTPGWFAAAAEGADLLEIAPELMVLPADLEAADLVDLSGIDLIRVYAPEMSGTSEPDEEPEEEPAAEPPRPAAPKPGTAIQMGLLRELGNLDD